MSIGLALGLHLGQGGAPSDSIRVAANNYFGAVGASSVANGGNMTGLCALASGTDVGGFQAWAALLSDGGLCWAGASATGGYTIQQVYTTHWPIMRDATPKRGIVLFSAGTNDVDAIAPAGVLSQAALDTRLGYIESFVTEAIANGQLPVICAPQPNETTTGLVAIPALRLGVQALAIEYGIPFGDLFLSVGDPDTGLWLDYAYATSDHVHLSATGARLIGQDLWEAIQPHINPTHTPDMVSTGDDTTGWAWQGGLFTVDANANGRPDGGGTGLSVDAWSAPGSTATMSKSAGAGDVQGNWIAVDKTGTPGTSSTSSTPTTAPGVMAVTAGDHYELAYHVRTNFASATAGYALKMHSTLSGSTYAFYLQGIRANYAIPDLIMWMLGVVPATVTLMRWNYGVEVTAANVDLGKAEIAMLSLKNVT